MFDDAVLYLGRWATSEARKVDSDGKPKYSIQEILNRGMQVSQGSLDQLLMMLGDGS